MKPWQGSQPDYPHHVTQRGNRRQSTFFGGSDYQCYIDLLADYKAEFDLDIWAYCLMPNHVHLVIVPRQQESLAKCLGRVHRKYALQINERYEWRGHLWQERFHSFVMDEQHLLAAVRYTELNPVRAGLCERPEAWPWSSARAHLNTADDKLVDVKPMLNRIGDWKCYLTPDDADAELVCIRNHTKTGRPAGGDEFLDQLEAATGRVLRKAKPGRKSKNPEIG
ncbi:MAG: hypothetical protein MAG794_01826 [Gammaproteobacteria bacterium]|nr:hypothetical protein [Gammaproteobacteria bacterium]